MKGDGEGGKHLLSFGRELRRPGEKGRGGRGDERLPRGAEGSEVSCLDLQQLHESLAGRVRGKVGFCEGERQGRGGERTCERGGEGR